MSGPASVLLAVIGAVTASQIPYWIFWPLALACALLTSARLLVRNFISQTDRELALCISDGQMIYDKLVGEQNQGKVLSVILNAQRWITSAENTFSGQFPEGVPDLPPAIEIGVPDLDEHSKLVATMEVWLARLRAIRKQ